MAMVVTVFHVFCLLRSVGADLGVLATKPLINFRKALEILRVHGERMYHKITVVSLVSFQKVMTNAQQSVAHQLNIASQQQIASNRLKLHSIVETILLCGRQNIPLRGHHDGIYDVENNPTAPHGNFWALLAFRVSAGARPAHQDRHWVGQGIGGST